MNKAFPAAAHDALRNTQLRRNLHVATTTIRGKRATVTAERPDWEELRSAGEALKRRVLRHLDHYLLQFESAVAQAGGVVHWARDAEDANEIVTGLVLRTGAREVVKVKSLTTDEIGVNDALAAVGVTAIETDLAELICQLAGDEPSHILVPAIHKNRVEIRDLFRRELGQPDLTDEPSVLAAAARAYLRERFLDASVAISGANFAVAETGTVCVVESEGNGRFCTTLPRTLITILGIEKLVPTLEDLEVFLQLLPRSSTGERMNPYTSLWTGVTPARRAAGVSRRPSRQRSDEGSSRIRWDVRRSRAFAAARVSMSARCTREPAGTRTARSIRDRSARFSLRSSEGRPRPARCHSPRAFAAPVPTCARSRSTSRRSSFTSEPASSARKSGRLPRSGSR